MALQIERLNVQDEIIEESIRYDIKDESGNIIYRNVGIEFITTLLQEGTPLNKALFDKVDRNFEKIKNNFNKANSGLETRQFFDDEILGIIELLIMRAMKSSLNIASLQERVTGLEGRVGILESK